MDTLMHFDGTLSSAKSYNLFDFHLTVVLSIVYSSFLDYMNL